MFSIKCSYSGITPSNIIDFGVHYATAAAETKLTKKDMTIDIHGVI